MGTDFKGMKMTITMILRFLYTVGWGIMSEHGVRECRAETLKRVRNRRTDV